MEISPDARWTNACGDALLCAAHLVFLYKLLARGAVAGRKAVELKFFTLMYYVCIISFQGQGAYMHVTSPNHAVPDAFWYAYVVAGCLSPSFYGAALSLDALPSSSGRRAALLWCCAAATYIAVAACRVDLADFLPLPRVLEVPFPNWLAKRCAGAPWYASALALNGLSKKGLGDNALTLSFDGRGHSRAERNLSVPGVLSRGRHDRTRRSQLAPSFERTTVHCCKN